MFKSSPPKAKQIRINLIPKDPFFSTIIGKILKWALSGGRYVVIFTELVVIVSFIARFTLDRQVTDLNASINQKKQITLSYGDLEDNFRSAQEKISQFKQTEQETNIADTFANLSEVIPEGVKLEELAIKPSSVAISGATLSQKSFNYLINNLQLSPKFSSINVGEIESNEEDGGLIFRITADTRVVQQIKANNATTPKVDLLNRTQGL